MKIYKIHGSVKNADKCIIARRDYDEFARTHDIVLSELKGEMCSNSFLFLGYSFSDTDIQHILTRIRLTYDKEHPQRHFSIIEEVKEIQKKRTLSLNTEKISNHIMFRICNRMESMFCLWNLMIESSKYYRR